MKRWMLKNTKVNTEKMAQTLGISPVMARVLANRGIGTYQNALNFIQADISGMYDGYLFKDMKKGIELLNRAIDNNTLIAVYGDYDVDGVMSSVILYKAIRSFTPQVMYYVPHRQKEGYGINIASVEQLHAEGVGMIICCDNGIAALEEAKKAKALGMDMIIIDHHEPAFTETEKGREDIIPPADAVIDHKQQECSYPFKALCAAGMSYKFARLLFESRNKPFTLNKELLVFAGMATICDIVDLLDENRIIAKNGLKYIKQSPNIGLQALIDETGLRDGEAVTEYHVGFVLGPCVNATGRLESAKTAIELFLTDDRIHAQQLAKELTHLNDERKYMTTKAVEECIQTVEEENLTRFNVLVVYNKSIHESIAGIVAGRLKERYYKPAIVLTRGDGMAKGSARSIEGYNIFEELLKLKELFHRFGGHPMAAGLTLPEENIGILRTRLNENCSLTEKDLMQVVRLEAALEFKDITMALARELSAGAPFGKENPTPVFGTKNVLAEKVSIIGKNQNILKLSLRDTVSGLRFDGIDFNGFETFKQACTDKYGAERCQRILQGLDGIKIDVAYTIDINSFLGQSKVQLVIKDFRL